MPFNQFPQTQYWQ